MKRDALYAQAKRAALASLGSIQPDGVAPDGVRFLLDDVGFVVRLRLADKHLMQVLTWAQLEFACPEIVKHAMDRMLEELARAQ